MVHCIDTRGCYSVGEVSVFGGKSVCKLIKITYLHHLAGCSTLGRPAERQVFSTRANCNIYTVGHCDIFPYRVKLIMVRSLNKGDFRLGHFHCFLDYSTQGYFQPCPLSNNKYMNTLSLPSASQFLFCNRERRRKTKTELQAE